MADETIKTEVSETQVQAKLPIDKMAAQMYPEKAPVAKEEVKEEVAKEEPKEQPAESGDAEDIAKAAASASVEKDKEEPKEESKGDDKPSPGLELKRPDDSPLEKAQFDELLTFANEQKLSQDQAQKLLERESAIMARFKKAEAERLEAEKPYGKMWQEREAQWRKDALADKEVGGTPEKLAENAELAKRAMNAFGDKQLVEFLNSTGLGSHPMTIRMFSRVGRLTEEGKIKLGGQPGNGRQKSPEERMYPNMFNQQNQ